VTGTSYQREYQFLEESFEFRPNSSLIRPEFR
jgi:hypothetical protein